MGWLGADTGGVWCVVCAMWWRGACAGPGDYFGELSLLNNDKRRATVRAVRPTVCLTLGRETFKRLLGPLETILKVRRDVFLWRHRAARWLGSPFCLCVCLACA